MDIEISYMIFDKIFPFVGWMVFLVIVYKVAIAAIEKIPTDEDKLFFIEMRDLLRTGISGALSYSEKETTKKKLKEMAYRHKDQEK
jgi:hypothetical protein